MTQQHHHSARVFCVFATAVLTGFGSAACVCSGSGSGAESAGEAPPVSASGEVGDGVLLIRMEPHPASTIFSARDDSGIVKAGAGQVVFGVPGKCDLCGEKISDDNKFHAVGLLFEQGTILCPACLTGFDPCQTRVRMEERTRKTRKCAGAGKHSVRRAAGGETPLSIRSGLTAPVKKGQKFQRGIPLKKASRAEGALVIEGNVSVNVSGPPPESFIQAGMGDAYPVPPGPPQLPRVLLRPAGPSPFPVILPLD